jgi:hypothetical protein
MGWTQRQARPAEPPTSRSEALASCTSHRGIGSIAASPLTALGANDPADEPSNSITYPSASHIIRGSCCDLAEEVPRSGGQRSGT